MNAFFDLLNAVTSPQDTLVILYAKDFLKSNLMI